MYPIFCSPKAARKRSFRLAAGSALTAGNMEAASSVSRQGYAVMQVSSLIKMSISMGNGENGIYLRQKKTLRGYLRFTLLLIFFR